VQSSSDSDDAKLSSSSLSLPAHAQRSLLDLRCNGPGGKNGSLRRRGFSTEGPELCNTLLTLRQIKGSDTERGGNSSLIKAIDDVKAVEENLEIMEIQKRKARMMFPYFGGNHPRLRGKGKPAGAGQRQMNTEVPSRDLSALGMVWSGAAKG